MRLTRLRVEARIRDLWIGCYWKHTMVYTDKGPEKGFTDVWICLVPCIPIHITITHSLIISFDNETNDIDYPKQVGRHHYGGDTNTETGKKWYRWWRDSVVGK